MRKTCKIAGCGLPCVERGRCVEHLCCAVERCPRPVSALGLCDMHYGRQRKNGDPLVGFERPRALRQLPDGVTSAAALGRLLGVSRQRAHQLMHRERTRARSTVAGALARGLLYKPDSCERCETPTTDLEAHHWDYHEALDVRWLCVPCHNAVHAHYPYSLVGRAGGHPATDAGNGTPAASQRGAA